MTNRRIKKKIQKKLDNKYLDILLKLHQLQLKCCGHCRFDVTTYTNGKFESMIYSTKLCNRINFFYFIDNNKNIIEDKYNKLHDIVKTIGLADNPINKSDVIISYLKDLQSLQVKFHKSCLMNIYCYADMIHVVCCPINVWSKGQASGVKFMQSIDMYYNDSPIVLNTKFNIISDYLNE